MTDKNLSAREKAFAIKNSPLATAFIWAVSAAASLGVVDAVHHKWFGEHCCNIGEAVVVAVVVGYSERKAAIKNGAKITGPGYDL